MSTGTWHRYDGFAYFPGALTETVISRLKGFLGFGHFTERLQYDAIASAKEFLPSVEDIHKASLSPAMNGQTMEGYLEKVVQVMSSLRFQMLEATQQYVDEGLVLKVCQLCFLSPTAFFTPCHCALSVSLIVFVCSLPLPPCSLLI